MSINIETTTTQQTTSDELDLLAKHLCGVKLTLSDSGVPTILTDSISTNGITASTTYAFIDTVTALASKGITVTYTNQSIRILDPNIKSILTANNIGDGTYITPALAAVASISNLLKSNTSIVAFDEFKYFTAANASATSFDGCTSLLRIDLSNCTNYCNYMFRNCSNLEYFNGVGSTSGVLTIPSGTTSIGEFTFSGLPKLTNVVFPSSIQSLDWYTFYNDSNLVITNLSLPNLSYLGNGIFYNTKIETVSDLGHITSISTDSFRGCTNLTDVNIPSTVTSIGSLAFSGDSNLLSITVMATTPPTFSGSSTNPLGLPNSILNTVNIYVPSSAVSTYQAASGWSSYASRIQAIPT